MSFNTYSGTFYRFFKKKEMFKIKIRFVNLVRKLLRADKGRGTDLFTRERDTSGTIRDLLLIQSELQI